MTHTRFRIIAAAGLFSLTLRAADSIEVHWDHLCAAADGKKLSIAKSDGSTVEGYCMSINVNEVLIRTPDRGIVKIARSTLSRLHMSGEKKYHLASLGKGFDKGLRKGFNWLRRRTHCWESSPFRRPLDGALFRYHFARSAI
jgi:hypothetical protein